MFIPSHNYWKPGYFLEIGILGRKLDSRNAEIGSDQILVVWALLRLTLSEYKRGKSKDDFGKKQYFF
jgi:hypothetical protein